MRKFTGLLHKELLVLASSPALFFSGIFFVLLSGIPFFFPLNPVQGAFTLRAWMATIPWALIIVIPVLSMTIRSDEHKYSVEPLLLSFPVTVFQIIMSKIGARALIALVLVVLSLPTIILTGASLFETITVLIAVLCAALMIISVSALISLITVSPLSSFLLSFILFMVTAITPLVLQSFSLNSTLAAFFSSISLPARLEAASRGVIDSRDISWFLCTSLLCMTATELLIVRYRDGKIRLSRRQFITVLLAVVLFATGSAGLYVRHDTTRTKKWTPSKYTRMLAGNLDSELKITWFRNSELLSIAPSLTYFQDFIKEIAGYSEGKIRFATDDPFISGMSGTLETLGIIPRQTDFREGTSLISKQFYSGLLFEYKGSYEVIPFTIDTVKLEYDILVRLALLGIAHNENPLETVYMLKFPSEGGGDYSYIEPWLAYAGFSVSMVSDVNIPDPNRGILLVLGSQTITDEITDMIKHFLDSGGKALFLVSPHTVNTKGGWQVQVKENDPLVQLLDTRGIYLQPQLVLDVLNHRMEMPAVDGSNTAFINYPFWVWMPIQHTGGTHSNSPVYAGIPGLQYYWPASISLARGIKPSYLLTSSPASITMSAPFDTNPFGSQLSLFGTESTKKSSILGVVIDEPTRMVVIADELFASDLIEYTGSDTNLDFIVNCAEWLAGHDILLDIKNKNSDTLSTTIPGNEAFNAAIQRIRLLQLVIIPLGILAGAVVYHVRRKRHN